MKLLIRDAVPADLDSLRDVFRRSSLSNDSDRANLMPNPDALELSDFSANEAHRRAAALADGRIAGFATGLIAGEAIELDDLFVDPDYWEKGIGRALILDVKRLSRPPPKISTASPMTVTSVINPAATN